MSKLRGEISIKEKENSHNYLKKFIKRKDEIGQLSKSLNVMGDGGMIATNDNKIANWLRKYRNHGMIDRDNLSMWGVNVRMQPLQAVVAEIELKRVEEIVKKRNKNAKYLDDRLLFAPHYDSL